MAKKNSKKNQNVFKVTPKVTEEDKIIQELQVKKTFLIRKLGNNKLVKYDIYYYSKIYYI